MMNMNYKTFEDLEFTPWKLDSYHAVLFFPNGYGVSVLLGDAYHSNGKDTYELAVLRGDEKEHDLDYSTPVTYDVLAYIGKAEVTEAMIQLQKLRPYIYKHGVEVIETKTRGGLIERFQVDKTRVYECNKSNIHSEKTFPEGLFVLECPICRGHGVIGELNVNTTFADEVYNFGGEITCECPLCKNAGWLLRDFDFNLLRIRIMDAKSVDEKIELIKKRNERYNQSLRKCNSATNSDDDF